MLAARAVLPALLAAALLGAPLLVSAPLAAQDKDSRTELFISGQMLVAAPRIKDPRFQKSVIYMIRHDPDGAFGLIVNRAIGRGSLKSFLKGLGRDGGDEGGDLAVHYGGPVQGDVGFVLHSADFQSETSRTVAGNFAWSPGAEALEAASKGHGPKRLLFTFGYSGWGPGQLEGEIERGDWLIAPADPGLVFELTGDAAWDRAREGAAVRL